jgi:hypothetical protein
LEAPQFPEWEGLSVSDFEGAVFRFKAILNSALDKELFLRLPFVHANGIYQTLINALPIMTNALSTKDFGQYQQASQQLDSLLHLMYAYGVVVEVEGLGDAERARKLYESEVSKLVQSNEEVQQLTKNVRALIEPGISGSLSKAFSSRVRNLFLTRVVWGVAAVALGVWGLYEATQLVKELKSIAQSTTTEFWSSFGIRSIVLIPIYLGFGFVLSQYKKERDFEEEYAHKAAISTSLPNYRDLAKDDVVKDQIASEAAKVIFAPPTRSTSKDSKAVPLISSIRELVDSVGKAAKRD